MLTIRSFPAIGYLIFFLLWNVGFSAAAGDDGRNGTAAPTYTSVHIGAVLDSNSSMGAMADLCISMALWDFYAIHSDYQTRLVLHRKDARDELDVASAGYIHYLLCAFTLKNIAATSFLRIELFFWQLQSELLSISSLIIYQFFLKSTVAMLLNAYLNGAI